MKKYAFPSVVATLILGLLAITVSPALTAAAAAPTTNSPTQGQALEIAPPVVYLSGNPGQTVTTQIYLRDITNSPLIVTGQANDFVAGDENGTPKIILNSSETSPYSLKSWVQTPTSLLLVPREIKTMPITFKVPANASPGGHYGVIRFTATPPSLKDTGVSLSASLGSLVLFTVNGHINHSLAIKEFSANKGGRSSSIFDSTPINFVERIENNGNEHEQPSGTVSVTNMFNKPVGAVNVNRPPKNILPASTRKFQQTLDKSVIGNKRLFGHYKATLNLSYAGGQTLSATQSFWVIPYKLMAVLAILLVAGFFGLRYALRRYNERIIKKAQRK